MATSTENPEERVLILAPLRKDAATVADILQEEGFRAEICADLAGLCATIDDGAGAILIAEEGLAGNGLLTQLLASLEKQPPWSELPVVLVTAGKTRVGTRWRHQFGNLAELGSVIMLERPLRSATLVSAMRSALRARRRQYQVRDHLRERERTEARLRIQEQELRRLNEVLEERVQQRTAELAVTNRQLMAEIEQRREAQRAFLQAQKMEAIGRLTGGIAHDFNNLLMVISGGLAMIDRATERARRDRILDGMRKAARRAEELTRQLLAFSRHTALRPAPIDLRSHLEGMRVLIAGAPRDDIALELQMPDGPWTVSADPTQLELAILNIAVNARDAMPNGGTLTIEAGDRAVAEGRGAAQTKVSSRSSFATPAPASLRRSSTASSIRSLPPRRSGRGRGSVSARSTALPSSRGDTPRCVAMSAMVPASFLLCPVPKTWPTKPPMAQRPKKDSRPQAGVWCFWSRTARRWRWLRPPCSKISALRCAARRAPLRR
jgi:signal transduction histidine kinase